MERNTYWTPRRKQQLLSLLRDLYPNPKSELHFRGNYQLVVSVALSAQCTDKKVNEVTPSLFERYPDFSALAKAKQSDVEKIIRQVNYYKSKSKNIIAMAKKVTEEFAGKLPRERTKLESLAGVGRKTASVILSERGIEPAFPVDTHVFRVARRLELAFSDKRDEVEEEIKSCFDPKTWRELHHWLIFHGRRVCKAQRPLCGECALSKLCRWDSE